MTINSTTTETCSFYNPVIEVDGFFEYGSSTCVEATEYKNGTSTEAVSIGGFDYSGLVISFFLFLIFSIIVFEVVWHKFFERKQ